jgi:GNAT superfamily N-acetyltransferase
VSTELVLTHHGSAEALAMLSEILPIYAAAEAAQMHDPFFWPDRYVQRLKEMYAPDRGFGLVAGRLEGKLVGYAFGRPRGNTADIWQAVKENLPDIETPASPEPIFIFCEFQVHPDHQRHGYGHKIHDALLASRPERLAHLLVRPDNSARLAYRSWGWHMLGEQRPFPDAPIFEEMVRELRV